MGIGKHGQAAAPKYEEILREVARTRLQGTPRQRYNMDIWEPAFQAHRPGGPMVGDPCS